MAINFTDSPANGATQTISGRTYTYNSAKNKWDTTATEVTGPTAAVYASVDNLPTSGNITGSQAFVSGTNRLYIWNGSGWYNIALINNNPSISGVASSYDLALDGTATTVTIVATDPEGLPITYSIASDTSGNTATVTQNANVFTITPSTNTANAGTFSLTFRASDGINLATAVSSFTLVFSVQNQRYTTALITSVGANNAVNNSFDDKSTNDHTITANGDVHQTTFSPYRHGGYSTYFDGSGDRLDVGPDNSFLVGTSSVTMECWCYPEAVGQDVAGDVLMLIWSGTNNAVWLSYTNNKKFNFRIGYQGGWAMSFDTTNTYELNQWYHVAVVRNSSDNSAKIYVNGVNDGSSTNSTDLSSTYGSDVDIGAQGSGRYFQGYITDARIVKDAVYTSAFTPPTQRLTAITNTSLLTCHLPYIADGSTNDHTIAINGDPSTEPFAPFDAQEYSASDHGGSAQFDGTGDYLATAADSSLTVGTGQFTLECWFQVNADAQYTLLALMSGSTNVMNIFYYHTNDSIGIVDSGWVTGNTGSGTNHDIIDLNIWHHLALVRDTTNMKLYVNGVERYSGANSTNYNNDRIWIGQHQYGNNLVGNISDVRLVKGTAVYTSNFTPPTAPLTAITNTSLLVQSTDAGIIDKSQSVKSLTLNGDVKSSTTQTKYLSSSMYFDGTGDYIKSNKDGNFLNNGSWTIEMWLRPSGTGNQTIGPSFGGGFGGWNSSNGHQWMNYNSSGTFYVQYYGTNNSYNTINIGSFPFVADTWYHYAISWDGTTLRFFKDGTSIHTTTTFIPQDMTATNMDLGRMTDNSYYFTGYYSDVRITEGLARYTASFTPPTAALKG